MSLNSADNIQTRSQGRQLCQKTHSQGRQLCQICFVFLRGLLYKFFPFRVEPFSEEKQNNLTDMPALEVSLFPLMQALKAKNNIFTLNNCMPYFLTILCLCKVRYLPSLSIGTPYILTILVLKFEIQSNLNGSNIFGTMEIVRDMRSSSH